MSEKRRYDVLSARNYVSGGEERTEWTRVGVAFDAKNGEGFDMTLHCIPVPQEGQIRLVVRVPKPREPEF